MNIDQAIEILIQDKEGVLLCPLADLKAAKQLGLEALKRIQLTQTSKPHYLYEPLPGETKD